MNRERNSSQILKGVPTFISTAAESVQLGRSNTDAEVTTGYYEENAPEMTGQWTEKDIYLGVIFAVFSAITAVGNIINIVVFASRKMQKTAFNVLLLGLAVTEGLQGAFFLAEKMSDTYCTSCNIKTFLFVLTKLGDLSFYSANWITVLISVFRCVAVCAPLHCRQICTMRHARIGIVVVVVGNAFKELPYWVRFFVVSFDETLQIMEPINQTLSRIIPCLIVLGTTLTSVVKVKSTRMSASSFHRKKEESRISRMLFVLLTVFFVSNTYCVIILLAHSYKVKSFNPLSFTTPIAFGVNSSINVFLYFCMVPSYRAMLRRRSSRLQERLHSSGSHNSCGSRDGQEVSVSLGGTDRRGVDNVVFYTGRYSGGQATQDMLDTTSDFVTHL